MTIGEREFSHLKQDFDRDGFIVLRNYLSPEETAEMRGHLDYYLKEIRPVRHKESPIGSVKSMDVHDQWFNDYLEAGPHIPTARAARSRSSIEYRQGKTI